MAFDRIRNLRPVKRHRSDVYILASLVTFALTVLIVRGMLRITGYPRLGINTVHIAHVIWGGLGLFAATILLLALANRWALMAGAVLSGAGMGLFIDEVGKFITLNNNYFTPAAAPIIYALFLVTVLVYLQVRRTPGQDQRGEMYRAFEQMSAVLDHEISSLDITELYIRLRQIQLATSDESVRKLATAMLVFVETEAPICVEPRQGNTQKILTSLQGWGRRVFTERRLRVFLLCVLIASGVYAVIDMALLTFLAVSPESFATKITRFLRSLVSPGELRSLRDGVWFSIRAVLEGGVGISILLGAVFFGLHREMRGINIAIYALIIDLTAVSLLVFYQDQFKAIIGTVLQYIVLATALFYRRFYERPAELDVMAAISEKRKT